MPFFAYNKDNQSKVVSNQSEPFLKGVPKQKQFALDTKQDCQSIIRILPPWSAEGIFALGTSVHWRVGVQSAAFICPNTVAEDKCPFCRVRAQYRGEWEKYQADLVIIGAKDRYYSNVINLQNPNLGPLVFGYGPQIYSFLKQFQESGQFGDITDPMQGRDINIARSVRGKKITDVVYPSGMPTPLMNPEWLDQMTNLDTILPEPDFELVDKCFKSHPWKVINVPGGVTVQVPQQFQTVGMPPVGHPATFIHSDPQAAPVSVTSTDAKSKPM
jgi:hypothetical protein